MPSLGNIFKKMHKVFVEKKSVNPVEESLGSTFKPETFSLKKEPTADIFEECTNIIENVPQKKETKKPRKTRFQENMLRLVEEKKSETLKLKKRNMGREKDCSKKKLKR